MGSGLWAMGYGLWADKGTEVVKRMLNRSRKARSLS